MCKVAGQMLDKAGIEYTEIDCSKESSQNPCEQYNVRHVPLIIADGKRIENINQLKAWIDGRR